MTGSARFSADLPLLPQLAQVFTRRVAPSDQAEWLEAMVEAMSIAAMEMRWYYVSYLCWHSYVAGNLAKGETGPDDITDLIQLEIANHRISQAIQMQMAVDERADHIPVAPNPTLPARRWNLPGTDRWVDISTVKDILTAIQTEAQAIPADKRLRWVEAQLKSRFKALNDRLKDGALWRLQRHAGALNGMQWRRLTQFTMKEVVHLRLHYSTAILTLSVRVGDVTTDHRVLLPQLFRDQVSKDGRKHMDSHFGPRALSTSIYQILIGIRRRMPLPDLLPVLQGYYSTLLQPLLDKPSVAGEIEKLGQTPTLVISTHGVLAQLPFSALHDGECFLCDRFDIVQAPPIYPSEAFGTGDIDFEALVGGDDLPVSPAIRVLADDRGLHETETEIANYERFRVSRHANIEIGGDGSARDWVCDDLRWLFAGDVALLSSHIKVSAREAGQSRIITPAETEIPFNEVLDGSMATKLLVLAGCDSQGQTDWFSDNEGSIVSCLRRQGAQAVVSTLWQVSDLAARLYNEALVSAILDGMPRSVAHGHAQRAVKRAQIPVQNVPAGERRARPRNTDDATAASTSQNLDHPFYWAPFILSGAWR